MKYLVQIPPLVVNNLVLSEVLHCFERSTPVSNSYNPSKVDERPYIRTLTEEEERALFPADFADSEKYPLSAATKDLIAAINGQQALGQTTT